ncbi:MAG: GNAT family N-acetyltransferase, partial [Micromonosporaceae bacterium]
MPDVTFHRLSAEQATTRYDDLRALYAEVYAEPPHRLGDEDVEAFRTQFDEHLALPGFTLLTVESGDELAGFSYCVSFPPGAWWVGTVTPPPLALVLSTKIAVIELLLRKPYRGAGLGRRLMDTLLAGRPERYAILLANPEPAARAIYRHWGWQEAGTVQVRPHWPLSTA